MRGQVGKKNSKRSAPHRSTAGCACSRAEPHVEPRKGDIYTEHGKQTLHETVTGFVGLDAQAESTAIGFREVGYEAQRFVGTVGGKFAGRIKAPAMFGNSAKLLIVYEAGPRGLALARGLRAARSTYLARLFSGPHASGWVEQHRKRA